jgi:hypothetical protein
MGYYRFDAGDRVVLARQPDEFVWRRHGRELTIGKIYKILHHAQYVNVDSYVIRNDGGCIVSIEDQYFDPAPAE